MELAIRFELTTHGLQGRCTTIVLHQQRKQGWEHTPPYILVSDERHFTLGADPGIEPESSGHEPDMLPLHQSAI